MPRSFIDQPSSMEVRQAITSRQDSNRHRQNLLRRAVSGYSRLARKGSPGAAVMAADLIGKADAQGIQTTGIPSADAARNYARGRLSTEFQAANQLRRPAGAVSPQAGNVTNQQGSGGFGIAESPAGASGVEPINAGSSSSPVLPSTPGLAPGIYENGQLVRPSTYRSPRLPGIYENGERVQRYNGETGEYGGDRGKFMGFDEAVKADVSRPRASEPAVAPATVAPSQQPTALAAPLPSPAVPAPALAREEYGKAPAPASALMRPPSARQGVSVPARSGRELLFDNVPDRYSEPIMGRTLQQFGANPYAISTAKDVVTDTAAEIANAPNVLARGAQIAGATALTNARNKASNAASAAGAVGRGVQATGNLLSRLQRRAGEIGQAVSQDVAELTPEQKKKKEQEQAALKRQRGGLAARTVF